MNLDFSLCDIDTYFFEIQKFTGLWLTPYMTHYIVSFNALIKVSSY